MLQCFQKVSDDLDIVSLLHNLHKLGGVQFIANHLQEIVKQCRFFLQLKQDTPEQQLLIGYPCDDIQKLFMCKCIRGVFYDDVDSLVILIG